MVRLGQMIASQCQSPPQMLEIGEKLMCEYTKNRPLRGVTTKWTIFKIVYKIFLCDIFEILIPVTTRYNVKSKSALQSSSKNVSMSLDRFLYFSSLATNLLTILFILLHLYSAYFISSDTLCILVNVHLSYRIRAQFLWMLSSLFSYTSMISIFE